MPTVCVISCSDDVHSNLVEPEIRRAGGEVLRLNTDEIVSLPVEIVLGNSAATDALVFSGKRFSVSSVRSVWYRRPERPQTLVQNPHQRQFAEHELGELLQNFYAISENAFWMSPLPALERARRKLPQLRIAHAMGMRVPKTLVSNSPGEVREFVARCEGRVIYKTLFSPVIRPGDQPELWGIPTTILNEQHLANLELIRSTGGIFQEYVEKDYEVRVTVIGEQVFSAKINSQVIPSASVDWRDAVARGFVEVSSYRLPETVEEQCRAITAYLGLAFGAIDLIRTKDGNYVFLEVNGNGQWLWVEEATGLPLTKALVTALLESR